MIFDGEGKAAGKRGAKRLDDAIAEEVGSRIVAGPDQPCAQRQCRGKVGGTVAGADGVDGPMQRIVTGGTSSDDSWRWADGDHSHPVLRAELVDQPIHLVLGDGEPRRRDVGGLHRGGRVEEDDAVTRERGARRDRRLDRRRDQERGSKQLQEEQPAGSQALPGNIGLTVADLIRPEVQRRYHPSRSPDLQEIQRDDHRQGQRQHAGGRRQETHASNPIRRRVS